MKKTILGTNLIFAVMLAGCGDGIGDVTSGGPSATPTPVPTVAPTATPVPTATPGPNTTIACKIPAMANCDAQCCSQGGSVIFRAELEAAQGELAATQPGLFFSNGDVRDNIEYMNALARYFQNKHNGNICAQPLGHDELRVKGDNNVAQHIDVLISDRTPWVGGAYTCRPSSF